MSHTHTLHHAGETEKMTFLKGEQGEEAMTLISPYMSFNQNQWM